MTTIDMNMDFDIGDLLGDSIESPQDFSVSDNTWLTSGEEVLYKVSYELNGVREEYSARVTLKPGATLNRISIANQNYARKSGSFLVVNGTIRNLAFNMDILMNGEYVSMLDFFKHVAGKSEMSDTQFETALENIGVRINKPQTLLFQQFGAKEEAYNEMVEILKAHGFAPVSVKNDNVINAFSSVEGVPIHSFQIGRQDRSESQTGQGFLDLLDAQVDRWVNMVRHQKFINVMKNQKMANRETWTEDEMAHAEELIKAHRKMATDISRTGWAGAQRGRKFDALLNQYEETDEYYPVKAPVGRFNLNIGENNEPVAFSLWRNSLEDNESTTTESSDKVEVVQEDPFANL